MIKDGFKKNICISYSETDSNLALKPFSLLNFLQDIAGKNSDELGFGYDYIHPKNLIWVVLKYRIEFSEYPVGTEDLVLFTEPRGYNRLFAYRDFELYKNQKCLCRIFSLWALVNTETKSMTPLQTAIPNHPKMQPFQKREDDLSFDKIKPVETPNYTQDFTVRYNDIDLNGHANNGNYIIWALEPLEYDFKFNHKIKTMDIVYKKEAKFGETVCVEIGKNDNTTIHEVKNTNGDMLCQIKCVWM